jgi:hypothetical protein
MDIDRFKIEMLKSIANDIQNDIQNFNAIHFDSQTVRKYFRHYGEAIIGLAKIIQTIIEETKP